MTTKITRHFCRKIDDTKLMKLWGTRMTQAELAKALGHHPWVLRRRAIKLGLPSSRKELWARLP